MFDEDKRFDSFFTFSQFWRYLISHDIDDFPEENALKAMSLGSKCELFCPKKWNSSSWTDANTTQVFHSILKEHMVLKSRVKDGKASIRFIFGRSKTGMEFESFGEFESCINKDDGSALLF